MIEVFQDFWSPILKADVIRAGVYQRGDRALHGLEDRLIALGHAREIAASADDGVAAQPVKRGRGRPPKNGAAE